MPRLKSVISCVEHVDRSPDGRIRGVIRRDGRSWDAESWDGRLLGTTPDPEQARRWIRLRVADRGHAR